MRLRIDLERGAKNNDLGIGKRHLEGPARVTADIEVRTPRKQLDPPYFRTKVDLDRALRTQIDLAAVRQRHLPQLANAGDVIGPQLQQKSGQIKRYRKRCDNGRCCEPEYRPASHAAL